MSFLAALVFLNSIADFTDSTLKSYFSVAAAALGLSLVSNIIIFVGLLWGEIQHPAMADWMLTAGGATASTALITMSAVLKSGSFALLHSKLLGIAALSAPVTESAIHRLSTASVFSALLCDVPFVIIQVLSAQYQHTWQVSMALSFALSWLSIVFVITQRLLLWRSVVRKEKAYRSDGGSGGGGGKSPAVNRPNSRSEGERAALTGGKRGGSSTPPADVAMEMAAPSASTNTLMSGGGGDGGSGAGGTNFTSPVGASQVRVSRVSRASRVSRGAPSTPGFAPAAAIPENASTSPAESSAGAGALPRPKAWGDA